MPASIVVWDNAWSERASQESFAQAFSKACGFQRQSLGRSSQRAKSFYQRFSFDFHVGASCGRLSRRENRKKQGVLSTRHAFVLKTTMFLTDNFSLCAFRAKEKSG
jgi:hypothetical protein